MAGPTRCRPSQSPFSYRPSLDAGIAFSVLFGLTLLVSIYFTARRRLWFLSFTLGAALEFAGWISRALAYGKPCSKDIFIAQTVCLILAPALYSAALYILLGVLVQRAPTASSISPRTYLIIFCTADFISLLLQAIGGGMASGAETKPLLDTGTNIIIGGIFAQLAAMVGFTVLAVIFLWHAKKLNVVFDKTVLLLALFATVLIFVRNVFRAIELLGGWNGYLATTERFLIGLDAAPMLLCQTCFCLLGLFDTFARDSSLLHRQRRKEVQEKDALRSSEHSSQTSLRAGA
ncbi:RTA1 like protein-domain-containing protein [Protomyces lactucae-debilis]|uniref:RTA1 like protein-domain-containing protein n=1 Tax=Protomyces lactucae-debilis TaxID=2754530 RepID=A0A1Y2EXG4_PROLT|nr:RTA1 like protein-domain-containing protein [Protomyces lactucae-debilis]ORY76301.1 RTA1 like protein-domain-containing protein [Protomyces lactucae-debilis]